jgi:hypothetical protein
MSITQDAAMSLAVCYQAYCEYSARGNDKRLAAVWAYLLLEAQQLTGVELIDPEMLRVQGRADDSLH